MFQILFFFFSSHSRFNSIISCSVARVRARASFYVCQSHEFRFLFTTIFVKYSHLFPTIYRISWIGFSLTLHRHTHTRRSCALEMKSTLFLLTSIDQLCVRWVIRFRTLILFRPSIKFRPQFIVRPILSELCVWIGKSHFIDGSH